MELLFAPALIVWCGFTLAAGIYAQRLNRTVFGWTFVAFVLSPLLAFVLLLALGPREAASDEDREPAVPRTGASIMADRWSARLGGTK